MTNLQKRDLLKLSGIQLCTPNVLVSEKYFCQILWIKNLLIMLQLHSRIQNTSTNALLIFFIYQYFKIFLNIQLFIFKQCSHKNRIK